MCVRSGHFSESAFVLVLVVVHLLWTSASPPSTLERHAVDFFFDEHHRGKNTTVTFTDCANLPQDFVNQATSVSTHGRCAQFYNGFNCTGNSIKIPTRSTFHHHLGQWNFNDATKSVGVCQDPCIPAEGESVSTNSTNQTSPFPFIMYSKPYHKGIYHEIEVNGCTKLEPIWSFVDRTKSVTVPSGQCVIAFVGEHPEAYDCVVDDEFNVYELRDGIPALDDFTQWGYTGEHVIKAVSPCQCQVPPADVPNSRSTKLGSKPTVTNDTANASQLTFYSIPNFKGTSLTIPLNFSGCRDFNSNEWGWEGLAESVIIPQGSCITVHRNHDCEDALNVIELRASVARLSEYNLDSKIRSISVCKESLANSESSAIIPIESRTWYYVFVIGFPIACILVSATIAWIVTKRYRKRYRAENANDVLTDQEIDQFIQGLDFNVCKNQENDNKEGKNGPNINSEFLAQNQPYNYALEIAKEQVNFDTAYPLGSGEFGIVYKGIVRSGTTTGANYTELGIKVAVKTTKPYTSAQSLRALLKEVKVMMFVGKQSRIVELVGCCTNNLRQGELLIVMELCEKGSLERYLKDYKANFVNFVRKGQLCIENPIVSSNDSSAEYVIRLPSLDSPVAQIAKNDEPKFDIRQLLEWCNEVAEGMEYLETKGVVHGDLAARNVLLDANLSAKISDFGLSRKLYNYSQYTGNGNIPLPWRWLPLESLKNLEFSAASDVWSYGIFMWEVFMLGEQPYAGVASLTTNFIVNLEQGLRPTIPPTATSDCYNIMSSCWDEDKRRRPAFSKLTKNISYTYEIYSNRISTGQYPSPDSHSKAEEIYIV